MRPDKSSEPRQYTHAAGGNPHMTQTATRPALKIEPSPRWVRGFVKGVPVVDSRRVVLVYGARRLGTYFFPMADVRMDLLRPSTTPSESGEQRFTLEFDG